jgi:hypothetical protein
MHTTHQEEAKANRGRRRERKTQRKAVLTPEYRGKRQRPVSPAQQWLGRLEPTPTVHAQSPTNAAPENVARRVACSLRDIGVT